MSKILRNRYVLAVPDLRKSADFYKNIMGFEVYEIDDPGWLFAEKDNCMLMLGECKDAIDPHNLGDHSYYAYLEVEDIDAYYQSILRRGGKPKYAPEDKPWGMREFPIHTTDGHRITIGQIID